MITVSKPVFVTRSFHNYFLSECRGGFQLFGIIVATHGKMSNGLVDAAELIIGDTENVYAINLFSGDDVQDLNKEILDTINKINPENGVVIFTDLFGASPFNQSTLAVHSLSPDQQENIYVVTGVNLPMLLEAINQKMMNSSVHEAINSILESGKQGIVVWQNNLDELNEDDDF